MRKLKTFIAVLMLVFVLGLAAPQALASDVNSTPTTPGETSCPPGDGHTTGFADWVDALSTIFGNSWTI